MTLTTTLAFALDTKSQLAIQQLVAATVEWITTVHNADDVATESDSFRDFVRRNFHSDARYCILDVAGKDEPEEYGREEFIEFFESTNKNVKRANRSPGLLHFVSHTTDGGTGTETVIARNTVWARLIYSHRPFKTNGNMAHQEWTFVRDRQESRWKLLLWNDWPEIFSL